MDTTKLKGGFVVTNHLVLRQGEATLGPIPLNGHEGANKAICGRVRNNPEASGTLGGTIQVQKDTDTAIAKQVVAGQQPALWSLVGLGSQLKE